MPARPCAANAAASATCTADAGALAFPQDCIERCEVAFDVVALPPVTPMLAVAMAAGKRVVTGADVAVLQALEQFVLYTGVTPSAMQVADAAAFAAQGRAGI
jgi:shikimate dehydrogenase